ncbi:MULTISPECIES: hypothetical protein [unclassified Nostoc]|nr:hypothetical protein [Nostoc sp. 'Peltigera membranacea cyanobiont' 213]
MLLAIAIAIYFQKFVMRRNYAKTVSNSHLSISSAFCVVDFSVACP